MKTKFIGLTGQTGAGKSTVSEFAAKMGYKIINADKVARQVMGNNSECLKRLAEIFGSDIINSDGSCNRQLLAKRAFSSREYTDILKGITHPAIISKVREYIDIYSKESDVIIFDAPQLFESGGDRMCDEIIAVVAPVDVRLKRLISRDGISESDVQMRMNVQLDEDFFRANADYIIDGSKPLKDVQRQFEETMKKVMET